MPTPFLFKKATKTTKNCCNCGIDYSKQVIPEEMRAKKKQLHPGIAFLQ
jgi:hypothetical protein